MSSKSSRKIAEETAGDVPRRDLPERVAVGRVLRPHGVRGEVAVEVLSDVPERLAPGSEVFAVRSGRPQRRVVVASRRPQKSGALVRFEGIEDRDEAEELRDALLEVDRAQVPAAPPGTYYWYELLGCRVRHGGDDLGEVTDLVEDGGGLLLVVSHGERQVPIPFVQSFLKEVDVERGRIELDLPPGLLEACASRS
jgi:16S rRNA processing protein RimM